MSQMETTANERLYLSIDGLATRWDVSTRTVRRLLDAGKLPKPLRLGSAIRFSIKEIERYERDKQK